MGARVETGLGIVRGRTAAGFIPRAFARLEHLLVWFPPAADWYGQRYRPVVQREIAMAGIRPEHHVLNIGCGAVPFTALHLARFSGCKVTAVDVDSRALLRAEDMVRRAGLKDLIILEQVDPTGIYPPFDVALLALQVIPKAGVLRSLAESGRDGARAIVREPGTWCRDQYDCLDLPAPAGEVFHRLGALERSVLVHLS